ncbi:hypothetical protein ABZP36_024479 [Zizania latifolia]
MDYTNAIHIIPDASGPDAWANAAAPPGGDSAIWATEDDYNNQWNADPGLGGGGYGGDRSSSQPQSRSGSEQPPTSKKPRGAASGGGDGGGNTSKSRAIGKMFFKTKLCCKFRTGTCPYVTNCNFAHGMEELRKPPPNWQEIVEAHEEAMEQREEHQIPILTSSGPATGDSNSGRAYKGRHCKKFYTEEGCPYGDACTFLHDEQSKARESVAISLSPTVGGEWVDAEAVELEDEDLQQVGDDWLLPLWQQVSLRSWSCCRKKCSFFSPLKLLNFADEMHLELHKYGGGLVDMDNRDAASTPDSKQAALSAKAPAETAVASTSVPPHTDVYHLGAQSQRSTIVNQRSGQVQRPIQKWKGPVKISRIYGDWIDETD